MDVVLTTDQVDRPPLAGAGTRLARLEVFNWGTFDTRVWTLNLTERSTLLTGDIGSGKSTMVDAVTTLLLPAHRVAYNKAAGAETRERSLKSYVLGHYKSERIEATGTSRPVALRAASSFAVVLGVFRNGGYDTTVTLAQVFWMKDGAAGQPDRFYVTADRDLSIVSDFSDFGGDIATLKRRLRSSGMRLHERFIDYGKDYRRRLGIESEQAMELFHQTVSMKSVGDLNDFVRSHMLEPFDAATWTDRLVSHFADLTTAHEAVVSARRKLAALAPILADCEVHDAIEAEIRATTALRAALQFWCALRKVDLLERERAELTDAIRHAEAQLVALDRRLLHLGSARDRLMIARAGVGGDRLGEVERLLAESQGQVETRQRRYARYSQLVADAGLPPVQSVEQFGVRLATVAAAAGDADQGLADLQNRHSELAVESAALAKESNEVNLELRSLTDRRSNIPHRLLDLRQRLSHELSIHVENLPFAGELIQVRPEASDWEGAAERLLHSFGLSLLVPNDHYAATAGWIDAHHLDARLVYFRVVGSARDTRHARDEGASASSLFHTLQIKESPFSAWLERELMRRADYDRVESMADFDRASRAVTRAGQVKGPGGRHEKDDRSRIDDRRHYVLGWDVEAKVDALLEVARQVQARQDALGRRVQGLDDELATARRGAATFEKLVEFTDFAELDWWAAASQVASLDAEKGQIESSSGELTRLSAEILELDGQTTSLGSERDLLNGTLGGHRTSLVRCEELLAEVRRVADGSGSDVVRESFPDLDAVFDERVLRTAADLDRHERAEYTRYTGLIDTRRKTQGSLSTRLATRMRQFRDTYPLETTEVDDSAESAPGYRDLHLRLVEDDLPRFEAEFKTYLNTNTIRDIAGFQAQLEKQQALIKERVQTINSSLRDIDYNPDRYIRLETQPTPNVEVRDFRSQLRACTENALSGHDADQYSEQKFLQVKAIVERLSGRGGFTEADRQWSRRVTDVRNWVVFSASERWHVDDTEHEHYTGSGGKSGGQKEKLAYTVLAASLAYQFKLEPGAPLSRTFRFVVIDEAFARGSDESTRYALSLFHALGLQLLVVTPLQKIHVIEPFVSAVGFVDNVNGNYSRLQSMTVEEYRERQLAHVAGEGWRGE